MNANLLHHTKVVAHNHQGPQLDPSQKVLRLEPCAEQLHIGEPEFGSDSSITTLESTVFWIEAGLAEGTEKQTIFTVSSKSDQSQ